MRKLLFIFVVGGGFLLGAPWERHMDASGQAGPVGDYRAPVTRQQLQEYLSDPDFEIWDLTIWRNERLKERNDYFAPDGKLFSFLTPAQQKLVLVGQLDGDIGNGGISQLFFNQTPAVPAMQESLARMGCHFAADLIGRELDRLADSDFIPKWIAARNEFARKAEGQWEEAWATFMEFMQDMFPDESTTDAYYARHDGTMDCVRTYIRENASDYFVITEE